MIFPRYHQLDAVRHLIFDAKKKGRLVQKKILIDLKYDENDVPAIKKIQKVSKQGQRIYVSASEINKVRSGYGFSIISTSKGLLTNYEANRQKIGGEIICELW